MEGIFFFGFCAVETNDGLICSFGGKVLPIRGISHYEGTCRGEETLYSKKTPDGWPREHVSHTQSDPKRDLNPGFSLQW